MNYGASDIYEIKGRDGKVFLVPAVKEYVVKIDLEKGMYLRPIEGMFE
jgi:ribosomal 30S subunit maturation factor RimM